MPDAAVAALTVLCLLYAARCSAARPETPAPPTQTAPESPTTKESAMPDGVQIERAQVDDPAWDAALDVTLAHFAKRFDAGDAVRVRPVEDPEGRRLPYLVDIHYGKRRGRVLVVDGAVQPPGGGAAAAHAYVQGRGGVAALPPSRHLIAELLGYFSVLDRDWLPWPNYSWDALDEPAKLMSVEPPRLETEGEHWTFVVQRMDPVGQGLAIEEGQATVTLSDEGIAVVTE